jgi:16S rRNA (guanine527-N7)-methyltransferase
VHERLDEDVEALATRYELSEASADALQGLVRLVDWGEPNFVPKSTSASRRRERRRPADAAKNIVSSTIAESLYGLELEPVREARRIADIGSGAGFPGLVLAIALPRTRVTLIEKAPEKCAFLRRAIAELELENVEVAEGDAKDWSDGVGECDVVTSRKVGRLSTMVEWSAPLLAPSGVVVLWPGRSNFDDADKAAADSADAAEAVGLRLEQVRPMQSVNRNGKPIEKPFHLYRKLDPSQPPA